MKRLAPIVLLVLMVSCADANLDKVAKALDVTAQSIGQLQTTVIQAEAQKLITTDTTRTILQLCLKIDQAGKEAVSITRAISKLDNQSSGQIMQILGPVIQSVDNSIDVGLIDIKDVRTRDSIRLILLSIQTTLNTIQLTLAGGA